MKILFLGTLLNPISIACLKALCHANAFTLLVCIDPPWRGGALRAFRKRWRRYGGRGLIRRTYDFLVSTVQNQMNPKRLRVRQLHSLKTVAKRYGIPQLWCENVNGDEFSKVLRKFAPDLLIVANFSQIVKSSILEVPSKGCLNVHPSLLPKYRGPSPIFWVLANKERITGITVHYLTERIDSGDIVLQREIAISETDDKATLESKCADVASEILLSAIDLIIKDRVHRQPQQEENATYFHFPRTEL